MGDFLAACLAAMKDSTASVLDWLENVGLNPTIEHPRCRLKTCVRSDAYMGSGEISGHIK